MRVPLSWLREHCDPGLGPEALAERLSMTGTEVERIGHVGARSAEGFVVGRVRSAEPHPDADRLRVCEVDVGEEETRTIVCGASNVAAGQAVAVALPGSVLPGGMKLERAQLRGVVSDGMILSEAELEVGDDAAGIIVLEEGQPGADPAAPGRGGSRQSISAGRLAASGAEEAAGLSPGRPLADVLAIGEAVLELEVTPNRPDCLGIYGVAREVHAVTGAALGPEPWASDAEAEGEGEVGDYASVSVEAPELCPRFTARVFTEVHVGPSPLWLKARLLASGQRPINNVVDITNYAMLLTAQPLHAFDLDRVPDGELIVRRARDGERMTTLDGVERRFDGETVLVCDREGPSGIAGIMGGAGSEVSGETTRVLLEVACWDGVNILRTSNRLGLRSEASTRFEKQLHPELALRAQRVAARLMVELCGARLVPGTIDVTAAPPPERTVPLRFARAGELLGMEIDPSHQRDYLQRLGYGIADAEGGVEAGVPPDRHYDTTREADLIEEVARIHGIDEHLPATLPAVPRAGGLGRDQAFRREVEDLVRGLGFDEVVSWSFVDRELAGRLEEPGAEPVAIRNPLSEEGAVMRTTLLGGLLDAAAHNAARGAERLALFESGRVYRPAPRSGIGGDRAAASPGAATGSGPLAGSFVGERPPPAHEPHRVACLASGPRVAPDWRAGEAPEADFFSLKAVLEGLASEIGAEIAVAAGERPFLHPGRAARVEAGGREAGWIGEIHPRVAGRWDLGRVVAFEIDLAALFDARPAVRGYTDLITYPAVRQDLAVTVPEEVPYERLSAAVREGGGELLRSLSLFDLYRGEQVGEGRKSLALRLEFRAPDRTLTEEEVARRRGAITDALAGIGGSLRE